MGSESEIWNRLFKDGNFTWKDPHELVVDLLPTLEQLQEKSILDLGCGAGRHLVFLSERGFHCHGSDHAIAGLEAARDWLRSDALASHLTQNSMHLLPYADGSFAAIICLYVIYHGTVERIRAAFGEILRVLRPNGLALVTFISDKHHKFGRGEEIERNTFITNIGTDAGIPHHFCNEGELLALVAEFEVLRINLLEGKNDAGLLDSHWALLLRKSAQ